MKIGAHSPMYRLSQACFIMPSRSVEHVVPEKCPLSKNFARVSSDIGGGTRDIPNASQTFYKQKGSPQHSLDERFPVLHLLSDSVNPIAILEWFITMPFAAAHWLLIGCGKAGPQGVFSSV